MYEDGQPFLALPIVSVVWNCAIYVDAGAFMYGPICSYARHLQYGLICNDQA